MSSAAKLDTILETPARFPTWHCNTRTSAEKRAAVEVECYAMLGATVTTEIEERPALDRARKPFTDFVVIVVRS